jgi:peptide/nickel transport system substrate-binding protein
MNMTEHREHPYIKDLKEQLAEGRIDRRTFLRYSTLLGLSATAAYGFVGKVTGDHFVRPAAAAMPKGGTVRIGSRVQEVPSPHAHEWVPQAQILFQVVQQLARTDQDNITRPLLLKNWEASDDLRTWTFHLRPDVTFRSGRRITADDVVWNFKHILDPETGSASIGLMQAYMLDEYDDGGTMRTRLWDANAIEKIDDETFRFNLKVPQVVIPEHLDNSQNLILDPEEGGKFGVGSNGTGPFDLVELNVGSKAVFKARSDYWDDGPYIDTLEFIDLGDDPTAAIGALASKQVHGLAEADFIQLGTLQALPHVNIHEAETANTAVVQMRVKEKPYDNPLVRQALRYATDSNKIVQLAVGGYGLPGEHHFVCPIQAEYAPLPEMTRDPDKARALLTEAGYPDGIDIEISTKKDPAWELSAVQGMVEQWKDAGIRCKINIMPSAQFWEVWDKFPLGFVAWSHRPLGVIVLALGFRTGVPWNAPEWSNTEFDDLILQIEGTLDIEERRELMKRVEIIMQEDGPIVQPVWRSLITAFDKRVKGFTMHPRTFIFGHELGIES